MSHDRATHQVILLHPAAPAKPVPGAACNGCGVCCAAEPCPAGMLVSRKRTGRCDALAWDETAGRYLCGLMSQPEQHVRPRWAAKWVGRWARRFIAAGIGCDSGLEAVGG